MKEAMYYDKKEGKKVQCMLCPHKCIIPPGKSGFCKVRKNIGGKLIALTYGKPVSIAVDPIEKKPLYNFHRGEQILSIGTFGCNFSCKHCQNYNMAREFFENQIEELETVTPTQIVDLCETKGLKMIAYTYNEPTVFYEYMLDIAKLARKKGIKNVIVSNGYTTKQPLLKLLPFIDAANIDLKSFSDKFYKEISNGSLDVIKENLQLYKKYCHLEITNLIIPTLNDNLEIIEEMCIWIKEHLGEDTPLHLSRFFPYYKLQHLSPTSLQTLLSAEKIARKHLKNIYLGNI